MKKLAIILLTALLVSSNFYAAKVMICTSGGYAYINNNGVWSSAGGCAYGPWKITLDCVVSTGNPNLPEASENLYATLNTPPTNPSAQPSAEDMAEYQALIAGGNLSNVWVNPLKLTSAAYNLIYGNSTYLPLFYVNNSISASTGHNFLNLYSDKDRTITIKYKTLDLTVLSSENVSVLKGYNSSDLNTNSLPNGTYIITVSTNQGYEVNSRLVVNH